MKTEPITQPRDDERAVKHVSPTSTNLQASPTMLHTSSCTRHRRKRHLLWEQANRESNGHFARNAEALARKFPTLTPMELRVCAIVKEMLPSWKIAEMLGICEKAVENYRVRARKKMKIHSKKPLIYYLTMV